MHTMGTAVTLYIKIHERSQNANFLQILHMSGHARRLIASCMSQCDSEEELEI
jgi:hypothetical protein